jgi:hypothetical protein
MQNKWLRIALIAVGAVLALCILLGAGIFVVRLSSQRTGRPVGLFRRIFGLYNGHGAVGVIQTVDIQNQTITLQLGDGTLQTVLVNKDTRIEKSGKRITLSDLKTADRITVIGSPDKQGQIAARWIRVFTSPQPAFRQGTPTPI